MTINPQNPSDSIGMNTSCAASNSHAKFNSVWSAEMAQGRSVFHRGYKSELAGLRKRVLRQLCREKGISTDRIKRKMIMCLLEDVSCLSGLWMNLDLTYGRTAKEERDPL